jgi:hypothetical protein
MAMRPPHPRYASWAGAAISVLVAVLVFTRFGAGGHLSRDEAIYTYAGQQIAHGVAPYAGIFDPKAPLGQLLAGLGAAIADVVHGGDLTAIRITFLVAGCLTVGAVYLLGLALFGSVLAAAGSAATFLSFEGFAADALGGPDAKTPGVLFAVLAMLLLVHRRWFWGAVAGALAALAWQPLLVYVLAAVAGAWLCERGRARRAALLRVVAGTAIPVAALALGLWIADAVPDAVEAAVRFPLSGIQRGQESLATRLDVIRETAARWYGPVQLWGGLVAFAVVTVLRVRQRRREGLRRVLEDPVVWAVGSTFLGMALFPLTDFQGYPDVYPLLPYAAIGLGGALGLAVAAVRRPGARRWATAAAAAAIVAALVVTTVQFSEPDLAGPALAAQRADAAAIEALAGGGKLYVIGDPTPLVLTRRRNPDRYIYLGSGVAEWKVHHTPGGWAGWQREIRASRPCAFLFRRPRGESEWFPRMLLWASTVYAYRRVGLWNVFVPRPAPVRRPSAAPRPSASPAGPAPAGPACDRSG